MTETITVETTCDHCKAPLDDHSPRWVLEYDARAELTPPEPSYPLGQTPRPAPRHLCTGCADPVLGTIITEAAETSEDPA